MIPINISFTFNTVHHTLLMLHLVAMQKKINDNQLRAIEIGLKCQFQSTTTSPKSVSYTNLCLDHWSVSNAIIISSQHSKIKKEIKIPMPIVILTRDRFSEDRQLSHSFFTRQTELTSKIQQHEQKLQKLSRTDRHIEK